jgi:hypothetical protein
MKAEIIIPDFLNAKPFSVVARYRGLEIKRTTMAHWCGPLEFCRNLITPTGGAGWWSINSIESAIREIDEAASKAGKPDGWEYAFSDIPPAGSEQISISAEELLRIAGRDSKKIHRLIEAVNNPALQMIEGWPLMSWRVSSCGDAARFCRLDDEGKVQCAVGFVNAPESRRAEFIPPADELPFPTTVVFIG